MDIANKANLKRLNCSIKDKINKDVAGCTVFNGVEIGNEHRLALSTPSNLEVAGLKGITRQDSRIKDLINKEIAGSDIFIG